MGSTQRHERLVRETAYLLEYPGQSFSMSRLAELFQAAKSSVSEDVAVIRQGLREAGFGDIETTPGAQGGVRYLPARSEALSRQILQDLCVKLSDPSRILPGGYLYMADLIFLPALAADVGALFAGLFREAGADHVLTMETKGIPLALMTAHSLNVPLVIARQDSRVTDGSSVSINYISGSSKSIRTMSLSRRALPLKGKILIIDDFMKGGGTARGLVDLAREFEAEVTGIGVLVATASPSIKLVPSYRSLLVLDEVDEVRGMVKIHPASNAFDGGGPPGGAACPKTGSP